ncbi:MAG: prolyl oligopeptidase family serine peptidase [Chloroflexi bacterium]|nr:prolyl oligopeptidase family serine peptidase [Chloroflexota bacterium]
MPQTAENYIAVIRKRVALNYWLYLPKDLAPGARYPFILFLHGAGERGDDLELVKKHGIPKLVEQQTDFPFITAAPQCPSETTWPFQLDALNALVEHIQATLPVDPARCYLTGLSMGGFGSWALGAEYPERWAAVAPICGGGNWLNGFPERVQRLAGVPVWAFHGAQDTVVPLEQSQQLVDILVNLGADAKLTVYPDAGHDSWTATYANPALYNWLLSHRKTLG